MLSSSLAGSDRRTPPPASAPPKSSPVKRIEPYFIPHKRDQVQAFDDKVQQLEPITPKEFLEYLRVNERHASKIPKPPPAFSMENFCNPANDIARSIRTKHFSDHDLLVFKDTGNKIPEGHVTGTICRPDITVAFENDWVKVDYTAWAYIRLAGEKASKGKSRKVQMQNAASYLHYLILARPDFLVAQGLLTTNKAVIFLLGIGGVGIRQLRICWSNKQLYKYIYAFIYRLYKPAHFADSSYKMTGFDEKTSDAIYAVRINRTKYPGFRLLHARSPFTARTHVLSNPSSRPFTVVKEQLCRIGRRFDEQTILTKIHQPIRVPGVVEAVTSEIVATPLSDGREKHRLGLLQTGSPFLSIPTAKKMLETLFDLLEVLRYLRFNRGILHRDISKGNVMYIETPDIDAQEAMEPLVFAKYLLNESNVPQETSLLLVDFNLGEDMGDKNDETRINRTGTPIFISRAVELGTPVPLTTPSYVPAVPKIPDCYAKANSKRIKDFPEEIRKLADPDEVKNQSQDYGWRHELDHDVESVFWLLLYWAMVAQPKGHPGEYIDAHSWTGLLGDINDRDMLIGRLSSENRRDPPERLTHLHYKPLVPLIRSLAAILVVDRHWLETSDPRKHPGYICEAFQRLILRFIVSNRNEAFMTCRVDTSLRGVQEVAQSQAKTTTPSEARDGLHRDNEAKRRRLDIDTIEDEDDSESQDEDDNELQDEDDNELQDEDDNESQGDGDSDSESSWMNE